MKRVNRYSRLLSKSRKKPLISATLCLFLVAVSFAVIGRIISIHFIANCMCDPVLFRGESHGADISVVEWFMIVGGLLLFAQLAAMVSGIFQRRFRWMDFVLGSVNVVMALLIIGHWLLLWSVWSPQHPASRVADSVLLNSGFGKQPYVELGELEYWSPENDVNWEPYHRRRYVSWAPSSVEARPNVYQHRATGVLASLEMTAVCVPFDERLENVWRLIDADRISPDTHAARLASEQYDWVFRDEDWRIIHVPTTFGAPMAANLSQQLRENPSPIDADEFFDLLAAEQEEPDGEPKPKMTFEEFVDAYMAEMERKAERRERQAR